MGRSRCIDNPDESWMYSIRPDPSRMQRSVELHSLMKRYILQLRHGCKSSTCTSPHCLTCKKRYATSPVRRPNIHTARMQALELASRRDPYAALCPHPPKFNLEDFEKAESEAREGTEDSSKRGDGKSLVQALFKTQAHENFERHGPSVVKPAHDFASALENVTSALADIFPKSTPRHLRENGMGDTASPTTNRRELADEGALRIITQAFKTLEIIMLRDIPWGAGRAFEPNCFDSERLHPGIFNIALKLLERLVRGIAARRCQWEIDNLTNHPGDVDDRDDNVVQFPLMRTLLSQFVSTCASGKNSPNSAMSFVADHMATLLSHHWNREYVVSRWDVVGATLEFLKDMYCFEKSLNVHTVSVLPDSVVDCHDSQISMSFTEYVSNPNTKHLLEFPFLFRRTLVHHFRVINYSKMFAAYRAAGFYNHMFGHMACFVLPTMPFCLQRRLKTASTRYLSLDLRRDNMLEDAFNQLRGREKRELERPLKIRLGEAEGMEIGVDQGGVAQEFFRLVFQKAFDDDYGMFVTDEISKRSWFRAASPVELYKFELVGLLFSLAVYNGAVATANMPITLYRRLLCGVTSARVDAIAECWPIQAQSLRALANWDEKDGKVEDVFGLEYKFSNEQVRILRSQPDTQKTSGSKSQSHEEADAMAKTEVNGVCQAGDIMTPEKTEDLKREAAGPQTGTPTTNGTQDVDEDKHSDTNSSSEKSSTACRMVPSGAKSDNDTMVTSENRHEYIADYVYWLTYGSVKPQLEAFMRGFRTLLDPKALSILPADAVQQVVEGLHDLDIRRLREASKERYWEGGKSHPRVVAFWDMVSRWSTQRQKLLLKFVTASDRIPAMGYESVNFVLEKNGGDSELLPSSSTCFGMLMMPEYSTDEKMEEKLVMALENCEGFGVP